MNPIAHTEVDMSVDVSQVKHQIGEIPFGAPGHDDIGAVCVAPHRIGECSALSPQCRHVESMV
jgi:hypothetical protein